MYLDLKTTLFLFDIDGTMTDTSEIDDECFKNTFSELYGFEMAKIDWSTFEHVTDTGLCREVYLRNKKRDISKTEFTRVQNLFFRKIKKAIGQQPDRFRAIEGINEFLMDAKGRGIPIAIATGGWRKSAELKLNAANIEYERFTLATSNDSFNRRTIMNVAIARAQFEYQKVFSNIIYFGDGVWDVETCKAMDMPMIGIDCHQNGKLENTEVNEIFTDFTDFKGIYSAVTKINEKNEQ